MRPNVWGGQHLIIDKPSCWRNVIRGLILKRTDNDTGTAENRNILDADSVLIYQFTARINNAAFTCSKDDNIYCVVFIKNNC